MNDMNTLFSGTISGKHRDAADTPKYKTCLLMDLGLKESDTIPADEALIRDFLVDLCMSVPWYHTELAKKMKRRRWYVAFNVILIVAVPATVYWLSMMTQGSGSTVQNATTAVTSSQVSIMVAQLAALFTGLFGLNRVFLEWQKANSRYAQLWEAAANLKTEYFALQTKWRGKVTSKTPQNDSELEMDIKTATANARAIMRKEQDDFYKSLSAACLVDALTVLKEVQSLLGQAVPGLKSGEATKQLEVVEKEQKDAYKTLVDQRKAVNKLEAELAVIKGQIKNREEERSRTPEPSAVEQADIERSLGALRNMRTTKETELVIAKGALAALIGT